MPALRDSRNRSPRLTAPSEVTSRFGDTDRSSAIEENRMGRVRLIVPAWSTNNSVVALGAFLSVL
ncbi:hypothetical protein ACFV4N_33645 [Actinosynnema sp. NPDC059797]